MANEWKPTSEIEIIAGTPPGGGTDRSARALLRAIEANKLIDVPAKVVNISGDGGRKAWEHIAGRAGDPNLIGINSPNNATDVLTGICAADTIKSQPLAVLYNEYMIFISRGDSPVTSGAELVRRLKTDPAGVTISLSTSLGNPNHIAAAKVIKHAGAPVTAPKIRVFDSARNVVADIVAGNADVGVITAASAVPELKANQVRGIAMSSPMRLGDVFTDVPTWKEQGVDCDVGAWRGAAAAAGITAEQARFWQGVLSKAVQTKEWKEEAGKFSWSDMYIDGDRLTAYLKNEYAEFEEILGALGLLKV
ncbi:MAG TPA: tripartite tricarboxylate transporter substrate-binding protein [Pseudolabrys sp.]|nr:tripartite tricarboxylate transporter substrate-binding protein [Pseudolabrys sp.]